MCIPGKKGLLIGVSTMWNLLETHNLRCPYGAQPRPSHLPTYNHMLHF